MPVINRETGLPPTEQEQRQIDAAARSILRNPYQSGWHGQLIVRPQPLSRNGSLSLGRAVVRKEGNDD
jgi:hypothetical protein